MLIYFAVYKSYMTVDFFQNWYNNVPNPNTKVMGHFKSYYNQISNNANTLYYQPVYYNTMGFVQGCYEDVSDHISRLYKLYWMVKHLDKIYTESVKPTIS